MATNASSRGQPSRGCTKCRSRKIKCDLGRPTCQRCVKIGHADCTYRDGFEIVLRDQTSQTAERAQEKWRSRSKKVQQHEASSPPGSDLASVSSGSVLGSASPQLSTENPIIQRFFYDWVLPDDPAINIPGVRFLGSLPSIYDQCADQLDSPLAAAVNAAAYANYAQRCSAPHCRPRAIEYCNLAMKLLQVTVNNPFEAFAEETFTTIQLLGLYEIMSSPAVAVSGSWFAHVRGQLTLLQLQGLENLDPSIRRSLLPIMLKQMLLNCLSRGIPPSFPASCISSFSTGRYKPADDHWKLLFKVTELFPGWRHALLQFTQSPSENLDALCSYLAQGLEIDKEMDNWAKNLPPEWGYTLKVFNKQSSPPWLWPLLETSWTPRWIHEYPAMLIEYKWREWWSAKVTLLQATLQSIAHMESRGYGSHAWPKQLERLRRTEVEHNLLTAIEGAFESCGSILIRPIGGKPDPKDIHEVSSVRGFLVFPILSVAHLCLFQSSFVGIDVEGRRKWGQAAMDFIYHHLGCAKAGGYKGSYQFEPLQLQLWSVVEGDAY